jgi:adenylyltransferase/sulfurtransferase
VGTIQANETVKLIIGKGEPLIGRLLLFDALKMKFREMKLRKNPECPVCGSHRTITKLIGYEAFCGVQPGWDSYAREEQFEITVDQLKMRLDRKDDIFILDVREPQEYEICNLKGHLIPLRDLPKRINELDTAKEIVVHCKIGGRSRTAVEFMKQAGFRKVKNLVGGIDEWAERIDPTMPRY